MLFPNLTICRKRINNFPTKDSDILSELWKLLGQNQIDVPLVQEKILKTLRSWQEYRNQPGQKNENFVVQILDNREISNSFYKLINISRIDHSLIQILNENENDIDIIYTWLVHNLFLYGIPSRIVTVSKTLLMLTGFSLALDSVVLRQIHN